MTIDVVGEGLFEANEDFTVNLSNPSAGWSIGDGQGLGTIQNDDAQPSIAIGDVAGFEATPATPRSLSPSRFRTRAVCR